jgi:hypothetical protein
VKKKIGEEENMVKSNREQPGVQAKLEDFGFGNGELAFLTTEGKRRNQIREQRT